MRLLTAHIRELYLRLKIKDKFLLIKSGPHLSLHLYPGQRFFPEFFRKKQNPAASRTDDGFPRHIGPVQHLIYIHTAGVFRNVDTAYQLHLIIFFFEWTERSQSVRKSVKTFPESVLFIEPPQKCKIIVTDSAECLVLPAAVLQAGRPVF